MTFRAKNYRQGRKRTRLTLSGLEFTRRFLLHVLPRGLPRVRYYGLLANTQRGTLLPRCRKLLGVVSAAEVASASADAPPASADDAAAIPLAPRCPSCATGRLVLFDTTRRPSWRELFPQGEVASRGTTARLPRHEPPAEDSS